MSDEKQKLVYILNSAGEQAERVLTAFALANIGVSMEHEVTVMVFGEATRLVYRGYAETVHSAERLPLDKLINDFLAGGGRILVCLPCIKARKVGTDQLIEGVEATTGTVVNDVILEADKVISF